MARRKPGLSSPFVLSARDAKAVAKTSRGAEQARIAADRPGFAPHPERRCSHCGAPAGADVECSVNGEFCQVFSG